MQFTSRQLLIFTAFCAVSLVCLLFASPIVGDLFYTLGLLAIAFAAIAAIYNRGFQRAYWVGFVICFAGYFGHTVWPSELRSSFFGLRRMGQVDNPTPDIITTRGLATVYHGTFGALAGISPSQRNFSTSQMRSVAMSQYFAFMTVGHTIFALVLGLIGGTFARRTANHTLSQFKRSIDDLTA